MARTQPFQRTFDTLRAILKPYEPKQGRPAAVPLWTARRQKAAFHPEQPLA